MYCLYPQQYKSKRVHVSKYMHFSDYWLRTSAVIHVYKARARRNGTGCLFQFTYCDNVGFIISFIIIYHAMDTVHVNAGAIRKLMCVFFACTSDNPLS